MPQSGIETRRYHKRYIVRGVNNAHAEKYIMKHVKCEVDVLGMCEPHWPELMAR